MNHNTTVSIPPGDPTNDMRPEKPRPCVGCAGHHGSVGAGILCTEDAVLRSRAIATELAKENARLREALRVSESTARLAPEQIEANQKQSEYFDRTRGRLKPTI